MVLQATPGIQSAEMTPEFVADNLEALLNLEGSQVLGVNAETRMHVPA